MKHTKQKSITKEQCEAFARYLRESEKSPSTVQKYRRDVLRFFEWLDQTPPTRESVLCYKEVLGESYAASGANSMLAALNSFFRYCEHPELCVRQFRVQKKAYWPVEKELSREEYRRLVKAAREEGECMALLLQTVCCTGIRIGELPYITVEAARHGEATVCCKGKTRTVFLVPALCEKLLSFAASEGVTRGAVFVTKNGNPMDRSNIWRKMKALCLRARVAPEKVFPHNLRHLFARTFYGMEKDIAKLADVLGHSNINTTRIYIITTGEEHRRKMEKMELVL